jgi:hypothetical protein
MVSQTWASETLQSSRPQSVNLAEVSALNRIPLVLPSLGVFSLAFSFRCLFLLLFLGALYVAWVLFYVGLFSVRTFFFFFEQKHFHCLPPMKHAAVFFGAPTLEFSILKTLT